MESTDTQDGDPPVLVLAMVPPQVITELNSLSVGEFVQFAAIMSALEQGLRPANLSDSTIAQLMARARASFEQFNWSIPTIMEYLYLTSKKIPSQEALRSTVQLIWNAYRDQEKGE